jgi:hypothetical protein
MPHHRKLSASAPKTTGLGSYSPKYEPLTYPCIVRAAHIPTCSPRSQKCLTPVQRLLSNLAYIQRGLNCGFPVIVTTFVVRRISETWN